VTLASPARRNSPLVLPTPSDVEWMTWHRRFDRGWVQGEHLNIDGPTQSGKSLLARVLVTGEDGIGGRRFVCVMGTKPKDRTLDEYVRLGFVRIDHWPPTKSDLRKCPEGRAWFILWPKIKTVKDLHRFTPLFQKALEDIYIDEGWTVVIDETLWFCSRNPGLNLGSLLGAMAFGVASLDISLVFLMQRPAGVPRILWQSCTWSLLFHLGVTSDVRELASLGTYPPKAVVEAIQHLGGTQLPDGSWQEPDEDDPPHQFLALPQRGGKKWSTSEVRFGKYQP
jgi:hypothetical protein